jgi:hypothetical protein
MRQIGMLDVQWPGQAAVRILCGGAQAGPGKISCLPNFPPCVTLSAMSDGALSLRLARPGDAVPLARIYVEAWRDTYAAILPHRLLTNMSVDMHAARLERAIRKGAVLAAETPRHGVLGLAGFGAARDHGLGFDGEVYTL